MRTIGLLFQNRIDWNDFAALSSGAEFLLVIFDGRFAAETLILREENAGKPAVMMPR